jgi:hypothetical protein
LAEKVEMGAAAHSVDFSYPQNAIGVFPEDHYNTARTARCRMDRCPLRKTIVSPMKLQLVTHCWNYGRLLNYHLSSFALYPPKNLSLTVTVFYSAEDERTCEVLRYFDQQKIENVTWHWWKLEQGQLFRRAIGRNMAALSNQADWVWFSDCDQVFHRGCLDALPDELDRCDSDLVFPRNVSVSQHHKQRSQIFDDLDQNPCLLDIDPEEFSPQHHTRAIGALQIVRGSVLRETGYCKDIPKYMKPPKRWRKTFEDVQFRKTLGTDGTPIELPGLFRIEHQAKGRKLLHAAQL